MKIIYNRLIPFKGFLALNLMGTMFVRKRDDGAKPYISPVTINHEAIHTAQMKELWFVPFYILYFLEWLVRLPSGRAYQNISFEREAYRNERNLGYLATRRHFAQWRRN